MEGLFDNEYGTSKPTGHEPLAERMRPVSINDVVGQEHILGTGAPLRVFVEQGRLPSLVLWGPPGTGKTTIAKVLATAVKARLTSLSAVDSGVKELREILAQAKRTHGALRPIVFIDEIHRFNKGQQDALLHAVEQGTITLIGATTENPSFEVNAALLSRCRVYRLRELASSAIQAIVERALATDLSLEGVVVDDWDAIIRLSGGDARMALNAIEAAATATPVGEHGERRITVATVEHVLQQTVVRYDKKGDRHYDVISAFIKSMRGSDPDAALLWLAVMIEAGEDPRFIARRLVVFASEDIGNADPQAINVAMSAYLAVERIGMPESRIILGHATTFLASAPKSNASYRAIDAALDFVRTHGSPTVPLHLRNAPSTLMKKEGFGVEYKYPHEADGHFVREQYFAEGVPFEKFYNPDKAEAETAERLRNWWPERWPSC